MKKKISIFAFAAFAVLSFAGCEHNDVFYKVDFKASLDENNTFCAGEPVRFNFDGQVDNLLFYSGESGAKYEYKDRYSVSMEDVKSAGMSMQIQAQYGRPGALEIYISNSFEGLAGNDGEADKALMKRLYEEGMPGWTKLEYEEGASGVWTKMAFDLKDYMENFCIAFHWKQPELDGKNAQRTYRVNDAILESVTKDDVATKITLGELNLLTLSMNEQHKDDPYRKNKGNGSIILDDSFDIFFKGVGKTELDFPLDAWCISTPQALNKVPNDKGQVIKNLQNYMPFYEYTYSEPGTYTATFVAINSNVVGSDKVVVSLPVIITDSPVK